MYRLTNFSLSDNLIQVTHNYSLAHDVGQGAESPDKKQIYVNIPKNASSELKIFFVDWQEINYKTCSPDEYLVVLRDPTNRWISAMAEFLVGNNSYVGEANKNYTDLEIQEFIDSKLVQNLIFNFIVFDVHTLPQCWFLQGLDITKIKFFYQDQNLINKIAKYTGINYIPKNINSSLTNAKKNIIIKKLTDMINNIPELKKTIDIHYYADHQLFDRITFEN
jgi:hypothetical protein